MMSKDSYVSSYVSNPDDGTDLCISTIHWPPTHTGGDLVTHYPLNSLVYPTVYRSHCTRKRHTSTTPTGRPTTPRLPIRPFFGQVQLNYESINLIYVSRQRQHYGCYPCVSPAIATSPPNSSTYALLGFPDTYDDGGYLCCRIGQTCYWTAI